MTSGEAGEQRRRTDRAIGRLAVPALGALVAQPIFLLIDAAVVGTLGIAQLAGLGLAGAIISTVVGLCVFLAYASTSSVARRIGSGDWAGAVSHGLSALVLGFGLGVVLALLTWPLADPLVHLLGGSLTVAPYTVTYLHVFAFALPAALAGLAGAGVLRGLQDTRTTLVITLSVISLNLGLCLLLVLVLRLGVAGSALATAVAEVVQATAYAVVLVRVARRHHVPLRPSRSGVLTSARDGIPLFWRTVALRVVYVGAIAVAARLGDNELAAYYVSYQVWILLSLAADSLAIAGQALLGLRLGAGDVLGARVVTTRLVWLGLWLGIALGALVLLLTPWLPHLFSSAAAVQSLIAGALLVVALQQPLAGPVFALDGILIGAGDGRWLALAGTVMALAFLPAAFLVLHFNLGVTGLWWALTWFLVIRGLLLLRRSRSNTWLIPGGLEPTPRTAQ